MGVDLRPEKGSSSPPASTATEFSAASSATYTLEQLTLHSLLRALIERVAALEKAVGDSPRQKGKLDTLGDVAKTLLSSWATFAILVILFFNGPLRDVLKALPDKIRYAQEIGVAGMTLKSTIQQVAVLQGVADVGKAIPAISSTGIQLLFRAPRSEEGILSYGGAGYDFFIPSDSTIAALQELADKGFVQLEGRVMGGNLKPLSGDDLPGLVRDIKQRYPGREEGGVREGKITWRLATRLPPNAPHPDIMWRLTDAGAAAVNVLITSVGTQLARNQENAPGK